MYEPGPLEPESRVLVVGDLHANTGAAFGVIDHAAADGVRVILQAGDFGWWPREEHGGPTSAKSRSAWRCGGLQLWWIDGNHEYFPSLARLPIGPDGRRQVDEHLWHLPRGFRWRWNRETWVAVGGGGSMDKASPIDGKDWFADEELTPEEAEQIVGDGPADIVLSHDAPLGVPYLRQELGQDLPAWRRDTPWPTGGIMRSDEHQRLVRAVVEGTHATTVFHGHHHARYTDMLTTSHGPVTVVGLGMDQDPLLSRCVLATPDGDLGEVVEDGHDDPTL